MPFPSNTKAADRQAADRQAADRQAVLTQWRPCEDWSPQGDTTLVASHNTGCSYDNAAFRHGWLGTL